MASSANTSSMSSPRRMTSGPENHDDISSNKTDVSALRDTVVRISGHPQNRPVKRKSLYEAAIETRAKKAGLSMPDAESTSHSESLMSEDGNESMDYTAQSTPPIDPFLKPHELDRAPSKLSDDIPEDPSIPDITNWTTDDVFTYFMTIDFPEAATILKDKEFDGQALSTARRADIVRGLGLPLGPALALYRIVVKLQMKKDDWTVCLG